MNIRDEVLKDQPISILLAVEELERRGLEFFVHFGTANAQERLREMDSAYSAGQLYEWMRDALGIIVGSAKTTIYGITLEMIAMYGLMMLSCCGLMFAGTRK